MREDWINELSHDLSNTLKLESFFASYLQDANYVELEKNIQQLLKATPNGPPLDPLVLGLTQQLEQHASRLAQLEPRHAHELYLRVALIHQRLTDSPRQAAEALGKAWKSYPALRPTHLALGLLHGVAEPPNYILQAQTQVGPLQNRIEALRELAARALDAHDLLQAETLYRRLLKLNPTDPDAQADLESIETLKGSAEARLATLKAEAAASQPPPTTALLALGEQFDLLGLHKDAFSTYIRALQAGDDGALVPMQRHLTDPTQVRKFAAEIRDTASLPQRRLLRRQLRRLLAHHRVQLSPPLMVNYTDQGPHRHADDSLTRQEKRIAQLAQLPEDDQATRSALMAQLQALNPDAPPLYAYYTQNEAITRHEPGRTIAEYLRQSWHPDAAAESHLHPLGHFAEERFAPPQLAIVAWRMAEWRDQRTERSSEAPFTNQQRLYGKAGRWLDLAASLERHYHTTPDAMAGTAETLLHLYEDENKLLSPALAAITYRKILNQNPTHPVAFQRLTAYLTGLERWHELAFIRKQALAATHTPSDRLPLLVRLGHLYADNLAAPAIALPYFEEASRLAPHDPELLARRTFLYEQLGQYVALSQALEQQFDTLNTPQEKLDNLMRQKRISASILNDRGRTYAIWETILSLSPEHPGLNEALSRHKNQDLATWQAHAEQLLHSTDRLPDSPQFNSWLRETQDCLLALQGAAPATKLIQQIFAAAPSQPGAQTFIEDAYLLPRRWADLTSIVPDPTRLLTTLHHIYQHTDSPLTRIAIHDALTQLPERDPGFATLPIAFVTEAQQEEPTHLPLARLITEHPKAPQRATALAWSHLAQFAPSKDECLAAYRQLSTLPATPDAPSELNIWSELLTLEAAYGQLTGLNELRRLTRITKEPAQLTLAVEQALAMSCFYTSRDELPIRAQLHRTLGALYRDQHQDTSAAIAHLRWSALLVPIEDGALDAIERLCHATSSFAELEWVYLERLARAPHLNAARDPLEKWARLIDEVLLDAPRATTLYQILSHLFPQERAFLRILERHLEPLDTQASTQALAHLYEAQLTIADLPADASEYAKRLFSLYTKTPANIPAALRIAAYLISQGSKSDLDSLTSTLTRLAGHKAYQKQVTELLAELYTRQGSLPQLVEIRRLQLQFSDPEQRQTALDDLLETRPGITLSPQETFQLLVQRFWLRPTEEIVWDELEDHAESHNQWGSLAKAWLKLLEKEPPALPPKTEASLRLRLARIYHFELLELEKAVAQINLALPHLEAPHQRAEALASLAVLHKKSADLEAFVEAQLQAASFSVSRTRKQERLIQVARTLAGALKRPEDAFKTLEPLWLGAPNDTKLTTELIAIAERLDAPDKLDQILRDAIDVTEDDQFREKLILQRATALRDRLDKPGEACHILKPLIQSPRVGKDARSLILDLARSGRLEKTELPVLDTIRQHSAETGDHETRLSVLMVQAELADAGPSKAALYREAAETCLNQLAPGEGGEELLFHAAHFLGQALVENADDPESTQLITALGRQYDHWQLAIDTLDAVTEFHRDEDQQADQVAAQLLVLQAEILQDHLVQPAAALLKLKDAIHADIALDTEQALEWLGRYKTLAHQAQDDEALAESLQLLSTHAPTPVLKAKYLASLADLAQSKNDTPGAIAALQRAHELLQQPEAKRDTTASALAQDISHRLIRLLDTQGSPEEQLQSLLLLAENENQPTEKRDLLLRAASLASQKEGAAAQALQILLDLKESHPHDPVVLNDLTQAYLQRGAWEEAERSFEPLLQHLDAATHPTRFAELSVRRAKLRLTELNDPAQALASLEEALNVVPTYQEARILVQQIEDQEPTLASQARERLLQAAKASDEAPSILRVLERIVAHDTPTAAHYALLGKSRLTVEGRPHQAWKDFATGYALEPASPSGQACRDALLAAIGDDPALARSVAEVLVAVANQRTEPLGRNDQKAKDLEDLEALHLPASTLVPLWRDQLTENPKQGHLATRYLRWAEEEAELDERINAYAFVVALDQAGPEHNALKLKLASLYAERSPSSKEASDTALQLLETEAPEGELAADARAFLIRIGRFHELLTLLEKQVTHHGPPAAHQLRLEMAKIHWHHLAQPEEALATLAEIPADTLSQDAIPLLEDLWGAGHGRQRLYPILESHYAQASSWPQLATFYQSTLEQDDLTLQLQSLRKLAEIQEHQLNQPAQAFETYLSLLIRGSEGDPNWDEDASKLEALAQKTKLHQDFIQGLRSLVANGKGGVRLLLALARAYEQPPSALEEAARHYGYAYQQDPTSTEAHEGLVRTLRSLGSWSQLSAHLTEHATRTEGAVRLDALWEAANLALTKLDAPQQALSLLEQASVDAREAGLLSEAFHTAQAEINRLLKGAHAYERQLEHLQAWATTATAEQRPQIQLEQAELSLRLPEQALDADALFASLLENPAWREQAAALLWHVIPTQDASNTSLSSESRAIQRAGRAARILLNAHEHLDLKTSDIETLKLTEVESLHDPQARAQRYRDLAHTMVESKSFAEAGQYWMRSLEEDWEQPELVTLLENTPGATPDTQKLASLYDRALQETQGTTQEHFLQRVTTLYAEQLDDPTTAAARHEAYIKRHPTYEPSLAWLAAYYQERQQAHKEADILGMWVRATADAEKQTQLKTRLGLLQLRTSPHPAQAREHLEAALPAIARDPDAFQLLERIYVEERNFPSLVSLYTAARTEDDPKNWLILSAKMAQIYELHLGQPEAARDLAYAILDRDESHRFALMTLERLERAAENWQALDVVLEKKHPLLDTPAAQAKNALERAHLAALSLEKPEQALSHIKEAMALFGDGPREVIRPDLEALLRAAPQVRREAALLLSRDFRENNDWKALLNVLMIALATTDTADEKTAIALDASLIAERELADPELAQRLILMALRHTPFSRSLRAEAARYASINQRFADLDSFAEALAPPSPSPEQEADLLTWHASLKLALAQYPATQLLLDRALTRTPNHDGALHLKLRLYLITNELESLESLLSDDSPAMASHNERARALLRAIYLTPLTEPAASKAQRETLLTTQVSLPDWRLIGPLIHTPELQAPVSHAFELLVAHRTITASYRSHLESALQRPYRAHDITPLHQLALIHELQGSATLSFQYWSELVTLAPKTPGLWQGIRRTAPRAQRIEEGLSLLLNQAEAGQTSRWVEALHLAEKLGPTRLESIATDALRRGADPASIAQAWAQSLIAHAQLSAAITAAESLPAGTPEAAVRSMWQTIQSHAAAENDTDALEEASRALYSLGDAAAIETLIVQYREAGDWDALRRTLEEAVDEAQGTPDIRFYLELASLELEVFQRPVLAEEYFENARRVDPNSHQAIHGLAQLAQSNGNLDDAIALWQSLLTRLDDDEKRARAYHALAKLQRDANRDAEAMDDFHQAYLLSEEPELKERALRELTQLYRRHQRQDDLLDTLRLLQALLPPRKALPVLIERLEVMIATDAPVEEIDALLATLNTAGISAEERDLLQAEIHVKKGQHQEAHALWQTLVNSAEPTIRARALLDQATYQLTHTPADTTSHEGLHTLVHGIADGDFQLPSRRYNMLARTLERAEEWHLLVTFYTHLHQKRVGPEKADTALKLAALYIQPLRNASLANQWLEAAESAQPGRLSSLESRLIDVDRMLLLDQLPDAESLLSDLIPLLTQRNDRNTLIQRTHQLGQLRERLGYLKEASEAYATAHRLDATNPRRLYDYGRALIALERWEEAVTIHQSFLVQQGQQAHEIEPTERWEVLERLSLASWELGEAEKARHYLNRLLDEAPMHPAGLALKSRFEA